MTGRQSATRTGRATAIHGVAVSGNSGNITYEHNSFSSRPVASHVQTTADVRWLAPDRLIGREREISELESFCAASDGSGWMWWRGPAWSGKTALLSSFVVRTLEDPQSRVRLVWSFVSRRLQSSGRRAFIDNTLSQMSELRGDLDVKYGVGPGEWESYLAETAWHCSSDGHRLVLVVDGLDEDDGVDPTRRDAEYSIAGVLPARLPEGVRVIVTARNDLVLPSDLPEGHPLRNPGVIRDLSVSAHARVLRDESRKDLERLIADDLGLDVLGYLVAAGAALSCAELAGLAQKPYVRVESIIKSRVVSKYEAMRGRRDARYTFAHGELRREAEVRMKHDMDRYRRRMDEWADEHRERGWPEDTPGYLLRDYFTMLRAAGDVDRVVALARDRDRRRLLSTIDKSGAHALAEISDALDMIAESPVPDVKNALELALDRNGIERNAELVPWGLALVWAQLGDIDRAVMLARTSGTTVSPSLAMSELVEVMVARGEAESIDPLVQSISWPTAEVRAYCARIGSETNQDVARELARTAREVALRIVDPVLRVTALCDVAIALRTVDRAESVAICEELSGSVSSSGAKGVDMCSVLVGAWLQLDPERAAEICDNALREWKRIPAGNGYVLTLCNLVEALGSVGYRSVAEGVASGVAQPLWRIEALRRLVRGLRSGGEAVGVREILDRMHSDIEEVRGDVPRSFGLSALADTAALCGDLESAESAYRAISGSPYRKIHTAVELVTCTAGTDPQFAARIMESVADVTVEPRLEAWALTSLARAWCALGDRERSADCAERAEQRARSAVVPQMWWDRARGFLAAVPHTADGAFADRVLERATRFAELVVDPGTRLRVWCEIAETAHAIGRTEPAARLLGAAEGIARAADVPELRDGYFARLADAAAAMRRWDRVREFLGNVTAPDVRLMKQCEVASRAGAAGSESGCVPDELESRMPEFSSDELRAQALLRLSEAALATGRDEVALRWVTRAERLSREQSSTVSDQALLLRARSAAGRSDFDAASRLLQRVATIDLLPVGQYELAVLLADAGELGRAFEVISGIEHDYYRSRALERMMREVDTAASLRMVADILRRGADIPIELVAQHDADAIVDLGRRVLSLHESGAEETTSGTHLIRTGDASTDGTVRAEAAEGNRRIHIVAAGETLAGIAMRYYANGSGYHEIAAASRLYNPDFIFPGQVLIVP
ncbi:LysM peptidoglycan-binding domain-containing protein [Nocardia sp. BMG51109]|uniref:LysM peptidoglycan-binding domain-containing protein n=1 Tax=Nocardia sp. BMG51109 TaxID=1056816 RepID=UPI00046513AE|nr:LysM peptidoglycan-binding domain-containing protein [Nocardia sp. BMG51109]